MGAEAAEGSKTHAQAGPAILVVDDDPLVLQALGSMLTHLGMRPVPACTGEAALELLAAGLEPALVILDMDMPGLGGAGTLPRLRALRPTLPVLIATGRMQATVTQLLRDHAAVGLMPKPFDLHDLRKHLARVVPEAQAPKAGGDLPA